MALASRPVPGRGAPVEVPSWRIMPGSTASCAGAHLRAGSWTRALAEGVSSSDATVTMRACVANGPGFAVVIRAHVDRRGRLLSGWSVQVDAGWEHGALLVRRWAGDRESHPVAAVDLPPSQTSGERVLSLSVVGDRLTAAWAGVEIEADLAEATEHLGQHWSAPDGESLVLRTWGDALVEVSATTVAARRARSPRRAVA